MKILVLILMIVVVLTMGCIDGDTHEKYTQATIVEKFEKTQPMEVAAISIDITGIPITNSPLYNYDYYIRYTTSGATRVDRVSKDVYSSIFENNTYVLKWGYVNELGDIHDEYGYVEIISRVNL